MKELQNKFSKEPYLFFGIEDEIKVFEMDTEQKVYYNYVAYNKGLTKFNKKAQFKQRKFNSNNSYSFPDVQISEIPKEALIQLKVFLDKKRDPDNPIPETTFCNTINTAVEAELLRLKQN